MKIRSIQLIVKDALPDNFIVLLVLFTLTVYATGLFPETTVDSAKYAAVSREVFESGDFIHLKIHGEPYMQKPPLLFWLAALSFKIFGVSMFAFKLPNLLFTMLGVYSTYRFGKLCFDRNTGLIAAIMFSTSEALLLYNMDLHTDSLLTSNIIFGVWQLASYLKSSRVHNFILGFVGVGLAMISKGLIGLAVPVVSIGGYLMVRRDFKTLFSLRWLAGLPVLLLILYPALKGLHDQFGMEGIKFYFWSNNIDRIQGEYSGYKHDYSYVIHTLVYIFLPWSLFAFTAIVKDFRGWIKSRYKIENYEIVYSYSVIIALSIIISVSSQQSPHYLLPAIPFFSIVAARMITDVVSNPSQLMTLKILYIMRNILVAALWIFTFSFLLVFFPVSTILIWIPVVIMFVMVVMSFKGLNSALQKVLIPLIISILTFNFVANTCYMPSAIKYHGPIQASYLYNRIADDSSMLYTYDYNQFETYFYPKNVAERVVDADLDRILSGESCWIITTERGYSEILLRGGEILTQKYSFPYKKLTNISLRFLYPATRESVLENIFLLKIK